MISSLGRRRIPQRNRPAFRRHLVLKIRKDAGSDEILFQRSRPSWLCSACSGRTGARALADTSVRGEQRALLLTWTSVASFPPWAPAPPHTDRKSPAQAGTPARAPQMSRARHVYESKLIPPRVPSWRRLFRTTCPRPFFLRLARSHHVHTRRYFAPFVAPKHFSR